MILKELFDEDIITNIQNSLFDDLYCEIESILIELQSQDKKGLEILEACSELLIIKNLLPIEYRNKLDKCRQGILLFLGEEAVEDAKILLK